MLFAVLMHKHRAPGRLLLNGEVKSNIPEARVTI